MTTPDLSPARLRELRQQILSGDFLTLRILEEVIDVLEAIADRDEAAAEMSVDPDAAAKLLAKWLGYSWDGLSDQDISDRYPDWSIGGSLQGGKPALRRIASAMISAATGESHDDA